MASSLITLLIGGVILIGGAWCFMAGPCKGILSGITGGGDSGQQAAATPDPSPAVTTPPTSGTAPDPTLPPPSPPTPVKGTPSMPTPQQRLATLKTGLLKADPKLLADPVVTKTMAAYMADLNKGHYNPALANNTVKAICNSSFCKKNPKSIDCSVCKSTTIKQIIKPLPKQAHFARLSGV